MSKHTILEYIIQVVIVVFGVFLGMMLNEWNSDRKANNDQKFALRQILKEVQEHEKKLSLVIPYHKTITQVVDSMRTNTDERILTKPFLTNGSWSQIPKWKGTKVFPLHTSAYETAKFSNIFANMDGKLLGHISAYYENIELYNEYGNHLTSKIFNTSAETKLIDILFVVSVIRRDLLGHEGQISRSSKELMSKIESKL